jgi:hypothetical protein
MTGRPSARKAPAPRHPQGIRETDRAGTSSSHRSASGPLLARGNGPPPSLKAADGPRKTGDPARRQHPAAGPLACGGSATRVIRPLGRPAIVGRRSAFDAGVRGCSVSVQWTGRASDPDAARQPTGRGALRMARTSLDCDERVRDARRRAEPALVAWCSGSAVPPGEDPCSRPACARTTAYCWSGGWPCSLRLRGGAVAGCRGGAFNSNGAMYCLKAFSAGPARKGREPSGRGGGGVLLAHPLRCARPLRADTGGSSNSSSWIQRQGLTVSVRWAYARERGRRIRGERAHDRDEWSVTLRRGARRRPTSRSHSRRARHNRHVAVGAPVASAMTSGSSHRTVAGMAALRIRAGDCHIPSSPMMSRP